MSNIRAIIALIAHDYRKMSRCMVVVKTTNNQKKTSNKSKLKQTKSSPNNKYKSSKPMKSKSVTQFRNKSNI